MILCLYGTVELRMVMAMHSGHSGAGELYKGTNQGRGSLMVKKTLKEERRGGQQTEVGFVLQFPVWVTMLKPAVSRSLLFPCLI